MLLQPDKAQLIWVENHCFIITGLAPSASVSHSQNAIQRVHRIPALEGRFDTNSILCHPVSVPRSNLHRPDQPNPPLYPCAAFFVPSLPTLQLPPGKGWHLPCSCLSPKYWNLSVAFHSHNEGITASGSSLVPRYYTRTA